MWCGAERGVGGLQCQTWSLCPLSWVLAPGETVRWPQATVGRAERAPREFQAQSCDGNSLQGGVSV